MPSTASPWDDSDESGPRMTAVIPAAAGWCHARVMDFNRAPFIVIWETTRACALACVHCRADAIARRDPRELSTEDAYRLMDQVRALEDPTTGRPPLFVLTGG